MAYEINKETCLSCGACAATCPVGAIKENDGAYEISKDECISCGACAATCPVEAISEKD